jgi:hypothetical protein
VEKEFRVHPRGVASNKFLMEGVEWFLISEFLMFWKNTFAWYLNQNNIEEYTEYNVLVQHFSLFYSPKENFLLNFCGIFAVFMETPTKINIHYYCFTFQKSFNSDV